MRARWRGLGLAAALALTVPGVQIGGVAGAQAACTVDMRIYDAQNGTTPSDADEGTRGAFTVVNANNTDGNNQLDIEQAPVPGEVDLIKIELYKPVGDADRVFLGVGAGLDKVKFWDSPTKGNPLTAYDLGLFFPGWTGFEFSVPIMLNPTTLWMEGITQSGSIRDIRLDYVGWDDVLGACGPTGDVATATIVWAEVPGVDGYRYQNDQSLAGWDDFTDPPREGFKEDCKDRFGIRPARPSPVGVRNCIAFRYRIYPDKVWEEPGVEFDIARKKEGSLWIAKGNIDNFQRKDTFHVPGGDAANDDKGNAYDESADPTPAGNFYSFDAPGWPHDAKNRVAVVHIRHFWEFVRVRFDGVRPSGNKVDGSKASKFFFWNYKLSICNKKGKSDKWVRAPAGGDDETSWNRIGGKKRLHNIFDEPVLPPTHDVCDG